MRDRLALVLACSLAASVASAQAPPQAWMQLTPGYVDKPTCADLNGDRLLEVICATDGGKVLALDGASGGKLWTVSYDERFTCCPVVDDVDGDGAVELIVAGGRTGLVLCLNGTDGSVKWQIPGGRDGIVGNGALADADGNGRKEFYYPQDMSLKAVDAASGNPLWEQRASDRLRGSVTVADIDGGQAEILVGSDDQELLCFTAAGQQRWAAKLRGPVTKAPVVCDANGDGRAEIYACGSQVARISHAGAVEWTWAPRSGRGLASSLAVEDVTGDGQLNLLLTSYDGKLYCLNTAGREVWSYQVVPASGGQAQFVPSSTPSLIDLNGDNAADVILCTPVPDAPKVIALNGKTGKALWSATLGAFSQCCPLVADVNGDRRAELIVSSANGRVYSYRLPRTGSRGWVKYGGDLANTGVFASGRSTSGLILAGGMPFTVAPQTVAWQSMIGAAPPTGTGGTGGTTGPAGRPASDIAVLLDGNWLALDPPPVMQGGSVLVPLRGIFEAMQASVKFDSATRTITAVKGATTVTLTLGSSTAHVNGRPVQLSAPAQSLGGSTFVPLRFIGEAFGATVKWDAGGRNVEIVSS